VYYSFGGTARYGSGNQGGDWYLIRQSTSSVTIKSGQSSVALTVYIVNDALVEPDETVVITLGPSAAYEVGDPASDTIIIKDDEQPLVSVTATDELAGEPGSGEGTGTFTFTRLGLTSGALTVEYATSGTATQDQDYVSLGTSVTFPAGASTVEQGVTVTDDALVEADETVIVTLVGGTGYTVGSPSTATITIKDDEEPPIGGHAGAALAGTAGALDHGTSDSAYRAPGTAAVPEQTLRLAEFGLVSAPVPQVRDGYLVLTYERLNPNPGFAYFIETSEDLVHWQPAVDRVAEQVTPHDLGAEVVEARYLEPVSEGVLRFLRLRTTRVSPGTVR